VGEEVINRERKGEGIKSVRQKNTMPGGGCRGAGKRRGEVKPVLIGVDVSHGVAVNGTGETSSEREMKKKAFAKIRTKLPGRKSFTN